MYRYKKRSNKRLIKMFIGTILAVFFVLIAIVLYQKYQQIDIDITDKTVGQYQAEKTQRTVEQVQEKNKEIADVIEEVTSSVVGISKIKNTGNTVFLNGATDQLGLGTGVIVSDNGYIITNEHVSGAKYGNCYVTLENGKVYNANVVWSDTDIDLSILKINAKNLPYAKLGDSDTIRVGETVFAIGNPIGFEFQRTVTSGIISAVNRTIKIEEEEKSSYMEDLIQTDATINPGNSGGPLISAAGEVIGINSVKITTAEGIGFAVPINIIKPIIEKFISTGNFAEPNIGIFAYDKEVIPYLDSNLTLKKGIYIVQLSLDGPGIKAGLKVGDIMTKIDSLELEKMSELRRYIYTKNPGEQVLLEVNRNNKTIQIPVTLGTK